MNKQVSFIDEKTLNNTLRQVDFLNVIEKATNNEKLKKTPKDKLPCILPHGIFKDGRAAENLVELTGMVVVDIDKLAHVDDAFEILIHDPYIYCMFVSPSGNGLKVFINYKMDFPIPFFSVIQQVFKYLTETYEGLIPDHSGTDVSRLCFIPCITKKYINKDAKIFEWDRNFVVHNKVNIDPEVPALTLPLITECYSMAEFIVKHKISLTGLNDGYDPWLKLGWSLAWLGDELGRKIFHMISSVSPKYNDEECDKKFTECIRTLNPDRVNLDYYRGLARRMIVRDVIYQDKKIILEFVQIPH